MLGKMKLTNHEVSEQPWDVVKKIEKIIRGEEIEDNVKFDYVNTSTSIRHVRFGGISITSTYDANYKRVCRRVKVVFIKDGGYEIDLDKIKAKYEEIKNLAKRIEERRKKNEENAEQNRKLISELKDGVDNIWIAGGNDCFKVELPGLSKEEVQMVVDFVKTLKRVR
jgi:hypothetical protein